jgi:3-oxoadipate enol-lactonase
VTGWCTADDGCRIAYSDEGVVDGDVVLLTNSLGTTRELWDGPAARFAASFRVVRMDNRGHGESDVPPGDYSVERLSRDALAVLDHLRVETAHVAGVSIGGQMSLWLAAHAPARVRRAVLLNTGARIQQADFWNQRIERARTEGLEAMADGVIARWFTEAFIAREPQTVARLRRTLASTPRLGYMGCCAALRDADLRAAAATVTVPTLVISGRHDQATPPELGVWLRDHTPGASLVEVDSGHLSPVEAPAAVADAMSAFLRH